MFTSLFSTKDLLINSSDSLFAEGLETESRHSFPYSCLRLFNSCSWFSIPWYFQLEPQAEERDYSEHECFGEQKSMHYKHFICTSHCEYKFSALSLECRGQHYQPQASLAASTLPAGRTGCTGYKHAPGNFPFASCSTRAAHPKTHEILTEMPVSSKRYIEDTVPCSINWRTLTCNLPSTRNSCGQPGCKWLHTWKTQSFSFYRPTPGSLTWMLPLSAEEHPKTYALHMLPPFLPLALQQPTCTSTGLFPNTASISKMPVTSMGPLPDTSRHWQTLQGLSLSYGAKVQHPWDHELSKYTPTCLCFLTPLQPLVGLRLWNPASSEAQDPASTTSGNLLLTL